jgi:hypothetical protein
MADNPEVMAEDRNKYKTSHFNLRRVIKRVKGQYRNNVESLHRL